MWILGVGQLLTLSIGMKPCVQVTRHVFAVFAGLKLEKWSEVVEASDK